MDSLPENSNFLDGVLVDTRESCVGANRKSILQLASGQGFTALPYFSSGPYGRDNG